MFIERGARGGDGKICNFVTGEGEGSAWWRDEAGSRERRWRFERSLCRARGNKAGSRNIRDRRSKNVDGKADSEKRRRDVDERVYISG